MVQSGRDDTQVRKTAHEWQKIQIAALGIVGVCGVLSSDGSSRPRPPWLQNIGAVAAIASLVFAVIGVVVVATVAHPVRRGSAGTVSEARLAVGIGLTLFSIGLTALAASTWWWALSPMQQPTSEQVIVTTAQGFVCGTPAFGGEGTLNLDVDGRQVVIPIRRVLAVDVINSC